MNRNQLKSIALAVIMLLTAGLSAMAQPKVSVKVIATSVSGELTEFSPGDQATVTLTVPLRVQFISTMSTDDGKDYVMFPQWTVTRFDKDGEKESFLKRQEAVTEYEFRDYGDYQINFAWSYRESSDAASVTIEGEYVDSIRFSIVDSEIKLYNAFSPNGDDINDVYKIYTRSIVSMKIAIYNRWGQTIKTISGPMDKILPSDAVPDADGGFLFEIWDGTYNGSVVNDGVYFINVQATGASGEKYEKRSDINILKGLGEGN